MKTSFLFLTCCLEFASSFRTSTAPLHCSSSRLFATTAQSVQASLPSPLVDAEGNVIESAEAITSLVANQRVALYFGAGWCKDCTNLEFMLAQYRSALAGSDQVRQYATLSVSKTKPSSLCVSNYVLTNL